MLEPPQERPEIPIWREFYWGWYPFVALLSFVPLLPHVWTRAQVSGLAMFLALFECLFAFGLLLVVAFFGALALLAREPRDRRYAKVCLVDTLTPYPLVVAGFLGAQWWGAGLPPGSWMRSFDREAWCARGAATNERDISPRQKMLGSAIRRAVEGSSRERIVTELGAGTESEYFRETGRDLIYALGNERGFISVDSEWLLIWCDESGRVIRWAVRTD